MLSSFCGILDGFIGSNGSFMPFLLIIVREESFAIFVGEFFQLVVAIKQR